VPVGDFNDVLRRAIDEIVEQGYDSSKRIAYWIRRLREAGRLSPTPERALRRMLDESLRAVYARLIERGAALRVHPGVSRYTLVNVAPKLRGELDRRILASAELIRMNRQEAIEKTLRRFAGWATSVPKGGIEAVSRRETGKDLRKAFKQLPFQERRVLIDQRHKLNAALHQIIAMDAGTIAARWVSHWRQAGYDYREDHKDRDGKTYLVRDSWAQRRGLVKVGAAGYSDEVTQPAEEPFCFPGSMQIPFADGVEAAYRRWYSGELTEIVTSSGKTLRGTFNHPIFTSNGWTALGSIHEGDDIIEIVDDAFHVASPSEANEDRAIPRISDIFEALSSSGVSKVYPSRRSQFHGNGSSNGDIDVVYAARPLSFGVQFRGNESRENFGFAEALLGTSAGRALQLLSERSFEPSSRAMRCLHQTFAAFWSFAFHANQVCFATRSNSSSKNLQSLGDSVSLEPKFTRHGQDAFFGVVTRQERVIQVSRPRFSGHVYNLQTVNGWYATEGVITHNCRCYFTWLYSLRDVAREAPELLTRAGVAEMERVRLTLEEA
jgi:hypothetical protein